MKFQCVLYIIIIYNKPKSYLPERTRKVVETILLVGCAEKEIEGILKILDGHFEINTARDNHEAMEILMEPDNGIVMVMLPIRAMEDEGSELIDEINLHAEFESIPVVVVTDNPRGDNLIEAYSHGIYDFIDLVIDPRVMMKRIFTIIEAKKNSDKEEAMNSYLFHHCIGAALLVEVEGNVIRGLNINDGFYELLGFDKDEFEQYKKNLMDTVLDVERDVITKAIAQAAEEGKSQCIMSNEETNRSFAVKYRRISKHGKTLLLLARVEDITDSVHSQQVADAVSQIPGMIFYDYSVDKNAIEVFITTKDGKREVKLMESELDGDGRAWISPESYQRFINTFHRAKEREETGSFEILARLSHKTFSWHRLYYRSIANKFGKIFRIVGRIDDLERNGWEGLHDKPIGLFDSATNLLTYKVVTEVVNQAIKRNKEGILILLDIPGIRKICDDMEKWTRQAFSHGMVEQVKNILSPSDIMGRFGDEGLMIFMQKTTGVNAAREKSKELIDMVSKYLQGYKFFCNTGCAVVNDDSFSATALISDANIALWEAKKMGNLQSVIFMEEQ